ncbi:MAG: deoxyribose-phosphate aldolase [Anaerolineales bacterium]
MTTEAAAKMIDLSCVRTTSTASEIIEMVDAAKEYGFGQVSVLQSFLPFTKSLLRSAPEVRLIGNVSFPSGSDSTSIKVQQAKEMLASGCDEIDMVMNIGKLRSGEISEVKDDVRCVIDTVKPIPIKVIIESMYLTSSELEAACDICVRVASTFIKTGTGWADRGTTVEDVRLIKSFVGNQIKIKASGGIRDVDTLVALYREGASRFGINLQSGIKILKELIHLGGRIEV